MVEARFVPYDDEAHRDQFFELNLEYLTGINELSSTRHGIKVNPNGTVKEYVESVFPTYAAIKPPEGVICILELDGTPEGMGVLKKLGDDVGEIKRMYTRPMSRGNGYGKGILRWLEERAREFGFSTLRLDTAQFAEAAVHIYRKAGFKDIQRYSGGEWDVRSDVHSIQLFMEKEL
jgi:GNAT superfamily N-acetyltransferase